jgi:GntR family histidine utilization transcriptional repressor
MAAPAYQAIKDYLVGQIRSGVWKEGDLVPSENDLARTFKVARMTVNRALRDLSADQVLIRVQGAGTYVGPPVYQSTLVEIRSIADEIRDRGHRHSAVVLVLEEVSEGPGAGFRSVVVHHEDGVPIQVEDRWVNPSLAPDYLDQDFTVTTPNEYLVRVAPLERVEYRIEARLPPDNIRERLEMESSEPCLLLHRRTFSKGLPASVADLWHPGNRFRFTGHF